MAQNIQEPHQHAPLPTIHRSVSSNMSNNAPARSRTDPPAPESQRKEKLNLHKRLHSNSLRQRGFTASGKDHGYRHAARETVQSAIELKPPISFDRLLRRDKEAGDPSRRGSHPSQQQQHHHHHQQQHRDASLDGAAQSQARPEKPKVHPKQIEKLRLQNRQREEDLRQSLKSVEDTAMDSTRQLDDTYYTILEKASALRSAVSSLQALAEEGRKLHSTFKEDTAVLESQTKENLDGFENFDAHEKTIDTLIGKLKASKAETDKLNGRLESARLRVANFEERSKATQRKRRKRWQMSWAIVVGVVALLIAFVVVKRRAAIGSRLYNAATVMDQVASPVATLFRPLASSSEDAFLKKLFDDL